jgi:hypothetical protein
MNSRLSPFINSEKVNLVGLGGSSTSMGLTPKDRYINSFQYNNLYPYLLTTFEFCRVVRIGCSHMNRTGSQKLLLETGKSDYPVW